MRFGGLGEPVFHQELSPAGNSIMACERPPTECELRPLGWTRPTQAGLFIASHGDGRAQHRELGA